MSARLVLISTLLVALAAASPSIVGAEEPRPTPPRLAPPRVASLVPFVSQALAEVAAPKIQLVASTRSQSGWSLPAGVADLGNGHTPDLERLVASGATVLVADRRWHARFAERAQGLGLEILWIEAESVEATLEEIERLGESLGAKSELALATAAVRSRLATLHLAQGPKILVVFGAPGSFLVATPRTWLGDLVGRVGAELAAAGATANFETFPGYLPLSDELLASLEIDAVMLVAHGDPGAVAEAFHGEWARLRGPTAGPVIPLDARHFAVNPGLGLGDAAALLVAAIDRLTPGTASAGR